MIDDPYETPKTRCEELESESLSSKRGCREPMIGCGVGGCLLPLVMMVLGGIFSAPGGGSPFGYLFICCILGGVGFIVGFAFQPRK